MAIREKSVFKDFESLMLDNHPSEIDSLIDCIINTQAPTSIRYHAKKRVKNDELSVVPWCPLGVYLEERPSFTLDPIFHAGGYYVQEASSMFLHHVLRQLSLETHECKILDLCAAPGGKTTIIADFLSGRGLLVANEVIQSRVGVLSHNIIKWGYDNIAVTNNDPSTFNSLPEFFDVILVDAPCSGEGMFRKKHESIDEWNLDHVSLCVDRQRRILDDIMPCLKPNGYLIYATCTYNQHENIDNMVHLANIYHLSSVDLDVDAEWGISIIKKEQCIGYQFFPHKVRGEGFFMSVLQKQDGEAVKQKDTKNQVLQPLSKMEGGLTHEFVNADSHCMINNHGHVYAYNETLSNAINYLLSNLKVRYSGVLCGHVKKQLFLPEHALALSIDTYAKEVKKVDLSLEEALRYLKKELNAIDSKDKGWLLVTYKNLPLGWIKNLGNRINNYLPTDWRIRMDIEL